MLSFDSTVSPRIAERQLTSEERSARAFQSWADIVLPVKRPYLRQVAWMAWQACWAHLERHYEEWVKS